MDQWWMRHLLLLYLLHLCNIGREAAASSRELQLRLVFCLSLALLVLPSRDWEDHCHDEGLIPCSDRTTISVSVAIKTPVYAVLAVHRP
ncbi:hypothetical protein BDZ89DRAFT_330011 [Hymenopellis radicata]|nr:hypothetical protein BDZ89DRAFT_330011 [Hymenopellis radicata]